MIASPRFLMVAGGAALAALFVTAGVHRPPAPPIEIPFTFETRQPMVQVRVNGAAPVPFIVDTGATIHVMEVTLEPAGAKAGAAGSLAGGGEGRVATKVLEGVSFEVDGHRWSDQEATLVPLGYPGKKHFAGMLGAPILLRYVVQFDFAASKMRLFDPASYSPPAGAVKVPFELMADLPVVHVAIDAGRGPLDARLMVDTGASTFIDLNRPFVEKHDLVAAMPDADAVNRPAAIGTPAPFLYGKARKVEFGGLTVEAPKIGLSRATSGSSSRSERDGVLGNALLARFKATFDYPNRVLYLEPYPAAKPAS